MTKRETWERSEDQINRKMDEDAAKKAHELQRLLDKGKQAQEKFWDALNELEAATGLTDWDSHDLSTWTVDDILQQMEKAWRKKHPTQTIEPKGQDQ